MSSLFFLIFYFTFISSALAQKSFMVCSMVRNKSELMQLFELMSKELNKSSGSSVPAAEKSVDQVEFEYALGPPDRFPDVHMKNASLESANWFYNPVNTTAATNLEMNNSTAGVEYVEDAGTTVSSIIANSTATSSGTEGNVTAFALESEDEEDDDEKDESTNTTTTTSPETTTSVMTTTGATRFLFGLFNPALVNPLNPLPGIVNAPFYPISALPNGSRPGYFGRAQNESKSNISHPVPSKLPNNYRLPISGLDTENNFKEKRTVVYPLSGYAGHSTDGHYTVRKPQPSQESHHKRSYTAPLSVPQWLRKEHHSTASSRTSTTLSTPVSNKKRYRPHYASNDKKQKLHNKDRYSF